MATYLPLRLRLIILSAISFALFGVTSCSFASTTSEAPAVAPEPAQVTESDAVTEEPPLTRVLGVIHPEDGDYSESVTFNVFSPFDGTVSATVTAPSSVVAEAMGVGSYELLSEEEFDKYSFETYRPVMGVETGTEIVLYDTDGQEVNRFTVTLVSE